MGFCRWCAQTSPHHHHHPHPFAETVCHCFCLFNYLTFNCFCMLARRLQWRPADKRLLTPTHTLWSRACLACYRKCLLAATLGSLIWSMSHSVIISLFWNFFHRIVISSCLRVGFSERWLMRETSFLEWKRHKWWCFLGQLGVVVQGILQKTATCAVLSQFLQQ